jgi:DNA-binding beta-propeller fold protein YncE
MIARLHIALLASALLAPAAVVAEGPVDVSFLYSLSSTTGFIPFSGASLAYDGPNKELFVRADGLVHVFNDSGMEVFSFGDNLEVASVGSIAATEDGSLLGLAFFEQKPAILRLNFRGELVERIELTGIPPERAGYHPAELRYWNGHIYLANLGDMSVMVVDAGGKFEKFFDVAPMLDAADKRQDLGFKTFNLDKRGNILFTIQPLFHGYVLSLEGKLREFGKRGSGPGKFNVVSGIAADELGNYYVTDILKSSVLVFDSEFRFVKEFGGRGRRPGSLAAPIEIEVGNGKIFVSQYGRRGVSVFRLESPPADS